jgi:hypothetical protein
VIDTRLRLAVFTSTPVSAIETFTDQSDAALDFGRDTFSISLATTDYVYLGYTKPFGATYVELTTPNVTANQLVWEYWNGTAWTALTGYDRTKGWLRSGFMTWNKPTDWSSSTVNGSAQFYVRAHPSANHSSTVVAGLNLVYADDYDLQTEFPAVRDAAFIPAGEISHIRTHVAVRNQLTQDLRNRGAIKTDSAGLLQNLTPWDLHDIEEARQAATFLALAKIFLGYSDNPADAWAVKAKHYEYKYKTAIDVIRVSYDSNDDGLESRGERALSRVTRLSR